MKNILLVEDNPQDEMLILRSLAKVNLANQIDVVRDGQQAVDYLFCQGDYVDRKPEPPTVVLLDIGLPRLSGLEVLQIIRDDPRTELIPVVILTSSDDARDQISSYKWGANSYIRKPIQFAVFAETVAKLGVYWVALNESPLKK